MRRSARRVHQPNSHRCCPYETGSLVAFLCKLGGAPGIACVGDFADDAADRHDRQPEDRVESSSSEAEDEKRYDEAEKEVDHCSTLCVPLIGSRLRAVAAS